MRPTTIQDLGCGDNSCVLGSPGSMASNGGCECFDWQAIPQADRMKIRRWAMRLKVVAETLEVEQRKGKHEPGNPR